MPHCRVALKLFTVLIGLPFAWCTGCSGTARSSDLATDSTHSANEKPSRRSAESIAGVVRRGDGQPLADAIVVVAHEVDGTIIYSGGSMLGVVERQADQLPGVGRMSGQVVGKAVTGSDGAFAFADLAPGPFTMAIVHQQRGARVIGSVVSPAATDVDVTLDRATFVSAEISGIALDPLWTYVDVETDSPWPNMQIALRMERLGDGDFATGPLPALPDGCTWRLAAYQRNATRGFTAPLLHAPIPVNAGARLHVVVDASSGERIAGHVRGPTGESMADVAVQATPRDRTQSARGTFTSADGSFVITGLAPGEYDVAGVRYRLRQEIGCGNGAVDLRCAATITVPIEQSIELRIDALIPKATAGAAAPSFSSETVDGLVADLESHRGKVVLLDFWATWCVLCLADMKHIANLHAELQADDSFAVIGISLDSDPRAVQRFLQRQRLPWPQLVLGPADVNPIARLYNVTSTPTTILIDRDGRIAATHVPGESLRSEVMRLLSEPR